MEIKDLKQLVKNKMYTDYQWNTYRLYRFVKYTKGVPLSRLMSKK